MQLQTSRKVSATESALAAPIRSARAVKGLGRSKLIIVVLLGIADLLSAITFSCIVPFFPSEAQSKGMSTSQIGLVIGIFQLTNFVMSPIFGKNMARLHASRVFTGGLLVTGICTIALGFTRFLPYGTPFFVGVLLTRIGQSVGNSAFCTSTLAIIGLLFPERIATLTGIMEAALGLGYTIGPILGSVLYEIGGFELPLHAIGVSFALVLIPSMLLFRREFDAEQLQKQCSQQHPNMPTEEVPGMLRLLAIPDLSLAIVSLFLTCICWCFYEPSLADYMATFHVHGWSPSMLAGLMLTLVSFAYLISTPFYGMLLDRYLSDQMPAVMMLGTAGMAVTTLLIGPSPLLGLPKSLFITGFAFVLLGFVATVVYVPVFKWCIEAAKKEGLNATSPVVCGCVSGFMQSSMSLGAFLATSLGGLSAQNIGLPWTATLVAGIQIAFLIVQIVYRVVLKIWARNRCGRQ